MAHSENLFDIIALEKCEVLYTTSQFSFCTIIFFYIKQEAPGAGAIFGSKAIV